MARSDITRIREYPVTPTGGRHHVLDRRTLAYRRPYAGQTIRPVYWQPRIPVLDQTSLLAQGIRTSEVFDGQDVPDVDALGSCTGNAGTAVLSCFLTPITAAAAGLPLDDPAAAEEFAIRLYADATRRDQWHDAQWPTADCGSSGLGVAKALRHRGLIHQYGTATNGEELCALLQTGPVLMGMPWLGAWQDIPAAGLLDDVPGWQDSEVVGGHAIAVLGIEQALMGPQGLDRDRTVLRARNSWGTGFGDGGEFAFSLALYDALRRDIDVIQPRIEGVHQ